MAPPTPEHALTNAAKFSEGKLTKLLQAKSNQVFDSALTIENLNR